MSLNANASNATNGLVFNYDASNNKSYRSPPIKNILNQITPRGLSVGALYNFSSGTENVYIPALGSINNCQYVDMYNDYNGGSGNCCPSPYGYGDSLVVLPSTLYTYAIVYKSTNGYTHPNYMYHYEFTSGGTYLTEYGVFANNGTTAKIRSLGNDWYWASATFTSNASAGLMNTGSWMYEYGRFNRFHVAKAMLVQGNYIDMPPSLWPALNTTVSNTQALVDLTGNNTITASSLTYASDGTFSFNGGGNYIDINNTTLISGNNPFTVEAWYNRVAGTGAIFGNYGAGYTANTIWVFAGGLYFNNAYYIANYGTRIAGKHHICVTRDVAGSINVYFDGVLDTSGSNATAVSTSQNYRIGADVNGAGEPFNGSIYSVKVYNKVLTAAEVKQNFNALRGRFGI